MEPDAGGTRDEIRLPFEPGDRFIQVHANGAILVVADDYRWELATLGQAMAVAGEAGERGTRVLVGHEVLDDRTTAALEAVHRTGATVVDFGTVIPPMTWPEGTTPLMTAAAQGRNDLIDDLLHRGVPADPTDDSGANALHHAALAGNESGVDLLVTAGLDPAATDGQGRTPADLAHAGGHHDLAVRLGPGTPAERATSAARTPATAPAADFGWRGPARLVSLWIGMAVVAALFVTAAIQWASLWSLALVGVVAGVLWSLRHLLRAGGPRRLRDGILELRTLTGRARLPVAEVRGVIVVPARGINGAPWQLVLCQDRLGPVSTAARLHALAPSVVSMEEAERFAGLAERHLEVVLGRGRRSEAVLAALAPALDRPDVVGNRWWDELVHTTT